MARTLLEITHVILLWKRNLSGDVYSSISWDTWLCFSEVQRRRWIVVKETLADVFLNVPPKRCSVEPITACSPAAHWAHHTGSCRLLSRCFWEQETLQWDGSKSLPRLKNKCCSCITSSPPVVDLPGGYVFQSVIRDPKEGDPEPRMLVCRQDLQACQGL